MLFDHGRLILLRGQNIDQVAEFPAGRWLTQLTTFVGRRAELAAVSALLRTRRLVTLTGVGGSGKTRLAAQLAADQAARWPDGVWWVELDAVTDPAQVAAVTAAAIGVLVEPVQGPLRSLPLQLRGRRMLVCLDNCEQVLEGAAEVAEALLRSGAGVTVLATSREPLGLAGETVWQVPPLNQDDALALFMERASLVRPGFTLDASSEAAVRTMCRRLDGIPLALELAAAWLPALTPSQIVAGLDDRFALLVRGPRGGRSTSPDPGGVDRVEPRPAGRARPDHPAPARRVRRRFRPGGGAGGHPWRRRHP